MFKITPGTCVCDQVPRDDSINLSNIIMIDYKCSYKSTQVRLITKYLGPCTQAPHTDVLAKLMDTYSCTPQSFAQHPK